MNQYLTHWIYPYKGKFHPQMIRAILNIIGLEKGDTVLDPFIGSGTTAVEAQLLGINAIGVDVSPLCRLQSWVKTHAHEVVGAVRKKADAFLDSVDGTLFTAGGIDPKDARDKFIGVRGTGAERIALYDADLRQSIAEMARVLKPGRFAVIVIGNAAYQGREIPTVAYTIKQARQVGLRLVHDISKIIFGLYNIMRSEDILIFRKDG